MAPVLLNPFGYGGGGGGGTYASEVAADTPLAWWRQGDASGTTMADSSGNSRSGTYSGSYTLGAAGLITGDSDTCVDYSGGSALVANAAWMDVATMAIEAVIKPDTVPGGGGYAFIASRDTNGTDGPWWFVLHGGKIELACWPNGTGLTQLAGATTLTAGNKYHVVGTYDGANMKVFVNGTQDGSVAKTGNLTGFNAPGIKIGNWPGANLPFDGKIDEVAFYSSLSSTRVGVHAGLV